MGSAVDEHALTAAGDTGAARPPRRRWGHSIWVVVAAPLVIFANGIAGRTVYAPGDGLSLFVPWFMVSARAWASGHLPTWNPWAQSGMPELGSSQAGVLYPPNLLFMVLPPIVANNLTIVVTFLVAGTGAWLLARMLTEDEVAAVVGGLGFGLCTFLFAHVGHQSMIAGASWLPWMLYGYERLRVRFTPWRLLLLAGVVCLALLGGHSQIFFMDLFVLGIYATGVTLLGRPQRPVWTAASAVVGIGAGIGLGAVQLLPTFLVSRTSIRQHLSFVDAMTYSLPKSHIPLLLFPFLFGNPGFRGGLYPFGWGGLWNATELSGYPGAALLVLAAAGLVATWRTRQARALLAVAAACLLMVLGPATPLSHLVYRLPVYGQFRAWGRYVVGLELAVAMLGAYGVMVLRRAGRPERLWAMVLAALAAAGILAAGVIAPRIGQVRQYIPGGHAAAVTLLVPCAAAVAGLLCVVVLGGIRRVGGRRAGAVAVTAVVAADLIVGFGAFYQWNQPDFEPAQVAAILSPKDPYQWGPMLPVPGIDRYLFIGADITPLGYEFIHDTDVKGMRSVNANNALMASDYAQAISMTAAGAVTYTDDLWRPGARVFDLLRVTTVWTNPASAGGGPGPGAILTGGTPITGHPLVRYTYVPKLPDAFLVGASQQSTFAQELDAIHGRTTFDPSTLALIDAACPACPTGTPGTTGSTSDETWGLSSVELTTHADRPSMLVVSQAWSRGWQATVDGRAAPVVRVDGLVQGAPVPAGTHRVVLTYHAPGLQLGFAVTVAVLLGLLVPAVAGAVWRRPKPPGSGGVRWCPPGTARQPGAGAGVSLQRGVPD